MPRVRSFGKRKTHANQHSNMQRSSENILHSFEGSSDVTMSASKKKIKLQEDEFPESTSHNNVIVDLVLLTNLINLSLKCKNCDSCGTLNIEEEVSGRKGLAVNLCISCSACGNSAMSMSSAKSNNVYDINIRLIYGLRCIGKGNGAAKTLCALLNLPPPPSKFERYTAFIHESLQSVCKDSMLAAVEEEIILANNGRDIVAAFDGTWQKPGHTSLNGVVCATGFETGKIIDFECLSKYCSLCYKKTDHDCQKNFDGYSGGMEAAGVLEIFRRSESTRGVRYVKYLGDGDSKGFDRVQSEKVYGPTEKIEKLECIGHVQKRMGARLRALRQQKKNVKLSDGKAISGRGRLTDNEINLLQNYYGLAIRRNLKSISEMTKAIWAIYFHKLSTDESPQHGLCPKGMDSWCRFRVAEETGEEYHHKHFLPEAVLLAIKPIFRNLSDPYLLGKCLHGKTQNPNESFNNCLWERVPKTNFVSLRTLKIGVMDAVVCFNDGAQSRIKTLKALGIPVGKNTFKALRQIDMTRIQKSEIAIQKLSKQARVQKRLIKQKTDVAQSKSQKEYCPGMF